MSNPDDGSEATLFSGFNFLISICLIISPWFFDYTAAPVADNVTWNSVIVGVLIGSCAAWRCFSPFRMVALSAVNIVLGIWTVISPWIFGYSTTDVPRAGTFVILGVAVIALAVWSGSTTYLGHRHQRHA